MPPTNGASSWRDVYELVRDSREQILREMAAGFAAVTAVTDDHEERLRGLEGAENRRVGAGAQTDRIFGISHKTVTLAIGIFSIVLAILSRVS